MSSGEDEQSVQGGQRGCGSYSRLPREVTQADASWSAQTSCIMPAIDAPLFLDSGPISQPKPSRSGS